MTSGAWCSQPFAEGSASSGRGDRQVTDEHHGVVSLDNRFENKGTRSLPPRSASLEGPRAARAQTRAARVLIGRRGAYASVGRRKLVTT
jgi:hypothetical protein